MSSAPLVMPTPPAPASVKPDSPSEYRSEISGSSSSLPASGFKLESPRSQALGNRAFIDAPLSKSAISDDGASNRLSIRESPGSPETEDLEFDTAKGKVTLWQFLLQLLLDPRHKDKIQWTSKNGEFVLLKAEEVAKLWGLRKDNNHRMNYDKLSRALRYYYQKNIIRKVQGHKFVYQFIGINQNRFLSRPSTSEGMDTVTESPKLASRKTSGCNKPAGINLSKESAFSSFSSIPKSPINPFLESLNVGIYSSNPSSPLGLQTGGSQESRRFLPQNYSQESLSSLSNFPAFRSSKASLSSNSSSYQEARSPQRFDAKNLSIPRQDHLPFRSKNRSDRCSTPNCTCSCHNLLPTAVNVRGFDNRPFEITSMFSPAFPENLSSPQAHTNHKTTPDHQSLLHAQRHLINMDRFREQIQRFAGNAEASKLLENARRHYPTPIFAPECILPTNSQPMRLQTNDPTPPSPSTFEPRSQQQQQQAGDVEMSENLSSSGSGSSSSTGGCTSKANNVPNAGGMENYIWMPIQVDLVERFMNLLAHPIKGPLVSRGEPPLAHSSSSQC